MAIYCVSKAILIWCSKDTISGSQLQLTGYDLIEFRVTHCYLQDTSSCIQDAILMNRISIWWGPPILPTLGVQGNICLATTYGIVFDFLSWLGSVGWFHRLLLNFLHYDSPYHTGHETNVGSANTIPKHDHSKCSFGKQGKDQQVSLWSHWTYHEPDHLLLDSFPPTPT